MADFLDKAKSMLGMGPAESISERYARQDRERAAKSGTPAPAPAVPAPAPSTQLGGMNVDTNARRMKLAEAGMKDGGTVPPGKIKGPGTGTSDSIRAKLAPGAFIAPADSTKQLQDVRLSNGETHFPPDLVSRVGAAALLAMRDATHTPVDAMREVGADGAQHLDDGGFAEQQRKRDLAQIPTSGYRPAPDGDRVDSTELGRNAANAVAAIPGAVGTMGAARQLLSASGLASRAASAVTPTLPYVLPGAGAATLLGAANAPAAAPPPAPAAQPAVTAPTAQPAARPSPAPTPDVMPTPATPGTNSLATQNVIPAFKSTPTETFLPEGFQPQVYTPTAVDRLGFNGAMRFTPTTYADKYGRAALDSRLRQEDSNIASERGDATSRMGTATQAATARAGQGVQQQDNVARQMLARDRFGIDSTAAGIDARIKGGEATAREKLLGAKTPEDYVDAEDRLRAIQGNRASREPQYMLVGGGTDEMGNKQPQRVFDTRAGSLVQEKASPTAPPSGAVTMLKSNPAMAAQFDAKYGPGAAARILAQK